MPHLADKRHGIIEHPLSLHGSINQLGYLQDLATIAGDTVTVDLLQQAIDRRLAIGRKRRLQSESPEDPPDGASSDADDQTLVDVLVFEASHTRGGARSQSAGEELTSRWQTAQENPHSLLAFEHPTLNDILAPDWDPGDYLSQMEGAIPARLAALGAGAEPTDEETERCRAIAVKELFEAPPDLYLTWEVVPLQSRTGELAYLAHIIQGDYPCNCEFVGVYRTAAAAMDGLKSHGYISLEHFLAQRERDGLLKST